VCATRLYQHEWKRLPRGFACVRSISMSGFCRLTLTRYAPAIGGQRLPRPSHSARNSPLFARIRRVIRRQVECTKSCIVETWTTKLIRTRVHTYNSVYMFGLVRDRRQPLRVDCVVRDEGPGGLYVNQQVKNQNMSKPKRAPPDSQRTIIDPLYLCIHPTRYWSISTSTFSARSMNER